MIVVFVHPFDDDDAAVVSSSGIFFSFGDLIQYGRKGIQGKQSYTIYMS